ncbi:flagellar biosynthesis protein FlhB [Planomicrobium sp. CPCC 101110]|uniref:flagellar biosynthesis protein FlhB n=1 Tax=Planomicrobium sp. CPCC 101110 TaxID=2599619 RepID=UPI0011B3B52C|nr:flagellar biosynthesis protein FlhB [Planomicrobium sp. CPCC 101110]TWT27837.1 flagellar biosynthesis protein FlhB [Planomicrobium sp. CPCC 101110]
MKKRYPLHLDLQFFSGEKTEKATPQKRQESKRKGQVAKSAEIPAALILLGGIMLLSISGGWMLDHILAVYRINYTQYISWELTPGSVRTLFEQMTFSAVKIVAPMMIAAVVLGALGNYVQVGVMFTTEPLMAKLERLNPIQGAKKIFAVRALVELLKSLLKIVIIGTAAFLVLWSQKDELFLLSQKSLGYSLSFLGGLTAQLVLVAASILMVLAVLDYLYQKFEFEKGIRMSKQDIRDEIKKAEGDPLIKSKIREQQRQMSMNRMIQDLPNADVLITNPTHYAVAIKYDAETMEAPTVIAMGKDHLALKIKEKAKEHGIVIMENKPLARALYAQVEVGDTVPEDLFLAVAEVLAYIYRLKGKIK